jgi:hypothetical protein
MFFKLEWLKVSSIDKSICFKYKGKNLAKLGESQMCKERLYELGSPKMRAQCEVRV